MNLIDKIIYCEGKHDAWFIEEILSKFKNKELQIVWDVHKFQDIIRTLYRGRSIRPYNPTYFILPVNSDYKDKIYKNISMQIPHLRPLIEYVGILNVALVMDENGEDYLKMFRKLKNEITSLVKNRFKGYKPTVDTFSSEIVVKFKESKVCYRLFTLPNSLETEIFRKYKSEQKFKRHIGKLSDPDKAIYIISACLTNHPTKLLKKPPSSTYSLLQNRRFYQTFL